MKICTAAQMRRLDEKAIKECGLPGVVLMENAGRGAAEFCRRHFGDLAGRRVAIVCGRGNNGGDGWVMARVFHGWGALVRVFLLAAVEEVKGDARINLDVALKMGIEAVEIRDEGHLERLDIDEVDLVVDAILGTGLTTEVRGVARGAIERINATRTPVMAMDLPSGLDSDTGRILGLAVRADLTVTCGLPKMGLFLPPGEELAGHLEVVDIGLPPHLLIEADPGRELLDLATLRGLLPVRTREAHKGRFGHVLILAGSPGKTGAAALAAQAAVRSGAGLVTLAVPASLNAILETKVTEAMTVPLPDDGQGHPTAAALDAILELAAGKSVLALGPGLGTRRSTANLVRALIEQCDLPLVVDADGLNVLADSPEVWRKARREVVITPHPGEMARLAGLETAAIQADRVGIASRWAETHGVVVVLKGYRTVVAAPDGRLFLNTSGGPHLASGGMGDILTGMIAALAGQGPSLLDAARLGVFTHGLAADRAAATIGPIGLAASDLLPVLPGLWPEFLADHRGGRCFRAC